jgi:bifunctional NMN adenylyltransferase/nudix hydrolase
MKVAYVIGRFQPFHNGHKALIDKALEIADRVVVVLGDTGRARDFRDPWTAQERAEMIIAAYFGKGASRIEITAVEDVLYDDEAWAKSLRARVAFFSKGAAERFLVGHKKDASTFYLDMFPDWQYVEVEEVKGDEWRTLSIDGTFLRNIFFKGVLPEKDMPAPVIEYIDKWRLANNEIYARLVRECSAVRSHGMDWQCAGTAKYGGPFHVAVDALLESDDHVLLIRRGGDVGNGALAMPGGFVDPKERLLDAALRELYEETGVKIHKSNVPPERTFLKPFDHPSRSMRGRIVTNVLHLRVRQPIGVKAGDDANEAIWVLKSELPALKRQFFSDHYHIVQHFIDKGFCQ